MNPVASGSKSYYTSMLKESKYIGYESNLIVHNIFGFLDKMVYTAGWYNDTPNGNL